MVKKQDVWNAPSGGPSHTSARAPTTTHGDCINLEDQFRNYIRKGSGRFNLCGNFLSGPEDENEGAEIKGEREVLFDRVLHKSV